MSGAAADDRPLTGEAREVELDSVHRPGIIYDNDPRTSLCAGTWAQVQRTKDVWPFPLSGPAPRSMVRRATSGEAVCYNRAYLKGE
jgi:hypothetical protein